MLLTNPADSLTRFSFFCSMGSMPKPPPRGKLSSSIAAFILPNFDMVGAASGGLPAGTQRCIPVEHSMPLGQQSEQAGVSMVVIHGTEQANMWIACWKLGTGPAARIAVCSVETGHHPRDHRM